MRIANIILTSQNGGAEQVFIDYSRVLKDLGHEVTAIIKSDAPYADELEKISIKPHKINNRLGFYDILAIRAIRKILLEENVGAVFAHMGRGMALARKAIRGIKGRKIFLIGVNHSMNIKRSIGLDLIISTNKQIFYKTIDAGQNPERSFVVENAIELEDTPPLVDINLIDKPIIKLGIIGRFDRTKGFEYPILLLEYLKRNPILDKKFTLKIAGDGYHGGELRRLVARLNLAKDTEFCGWVSSKADFFNDIDVLIFPSKEEPFGLVLLEAMKYQRPIIASNADGPKDIIRNGIDAMIFDVKGDDDEVVKRIYDKLKLIIEDKNLPNLLIQNSLKRLEDKYSFRSLSDKIQEIVGCGN